jgi:hypothetical protein
MNEKSSQQSMHSVDEGLVTLMLVVAMAVCTVKRDLFGVFLVEGACSAFSVDCIVTASLVTATAASEYERDAVVVALCRQVSSML